ncbi:MAG TPA: energy transducer TonB [Cyclobacteriaceae bacterium]|nr:energy transducer TonB [Cyclobacteriaceae bacterium]
MEVKKNPNADLTRKTSFFFSVGLLVTMSIVLTAFEWKQHESKIEELVQRNVDAIDDMNVLATVIPPPQPPPVVKAIVIKEVEDNEELEEEMPSINIEVTGLTAMPEIKIVPVDEPEETEEIFRFVESPATFDGGLNAFYKLVGEKIKYPVQARRMGIYGKVNVEFVIDKDGTIIDAVALNKIGGGCDEEAIRVIKSSPKWNPGKQRGKAVKQRMVLPITFALN